MTETQKTEIELAVHEVAYPGRGVGRHEGLVVFLPGVLPGEKVRARILRRHKKHADAVPMEILSPSAHRTEPACPLAARCPGCRYQHVAYSEELNLKQAQLQSLLARIGRIDDVVFEAPVASGRQHEYRNKIKMHAHIGKKYLSLGYIGEDNRSVIDVPQCPLAEPSINSDLARLRNNAQFADQLRSGMTLTLRYTPDDGVVSWLDRCERMQMLTEQTVLGPVQVPCYSFFQVNRDCAALVMDHVIAVFKTVAPEFVLDLYSGVGVFALAAARIGNVTALGLDSDSAAIGAARKNARDLSLPSATFRCVSVEAGVADALDSRPPESTAVVVDPPRTGLPPEVTAALLEKAPRDIIYVSCAPDTLARDMRKLYEGGYRARSTRLFDMFPRTPYFETVAHLRLDP